MRFVQLHRGRRLEIRDTRHKAVEATSHLASGLLLAGEVTVEADTLLLVSEQGQILLVGWLNFNHARDVDKTEVVAVAFHHGWVHRLPDLQIAH